MRALVARQLRLHWPWVAGPLAAYAALRAWEALDAWLSPTPQAYACWSF